MAGFVIISAWTVLRRWGGVGLFFLGILDSSLIPTFGSLDALTAVLSVRHKDLWLYYAVMSTLGSLLGALATYRIGRNAGKSGLERRFRSNRLERVQHAFARWGFGAVFVPAIVPPPFPTTLFFVGAGAFGYPVKKYVAAVASARILRYSAIALIGAKFGRHIIRYLRHPQRYMLTSLTITAAIVGLVILFTILWKYLQPRPESSGSGPA